MSKDEALKMAIDSLEMHVPHYIKDRGCKAIQACKEALEQPAQEPVEYLGALATMDGSVNLYYKKSSWQELNGDDMHKIIVKYVSVDCTCDPYEFARAIEQALKEKNNE
jgi:hypothetical protein